MPRPWPSIEFFSKSQESQHHLWLVAATFHLGGSSRIFQDKVKMLRALVLCSPSKHIFCFALLTLQYACVWLIERDAQASAKQELCPDLWFHGVLIWLMAETLSGDDTNLLMSRGTVYLLQGSGQRWMKPADWTLLSQWNCPVSLTIS